MTTPLSRRLSSSAALLFLLLAANGCVIKNVGTTVESTIKGDYFLQYEKFDEGLKSFQQAVAENPGNALTRYYYGRFLLLDGKKKEALNQFKKALELDGNNADYHFWTGLAYSENGNREREAKHYQQALSLNSRHLQSLIYMGHNLLEKKQYGNALDYYTRALAVWPGSPSALYNRALIMKRLDRTPEEQLGWHEYLAFHPSGGLARKAVDNLNVLGEFSFRNHHLGARTITIEKIRFEPFTAKLDAASKDSLTVIGTVITNLPEGTLQVVTYQKNNTKLARKRAVSIKRHLLDKFPQLAAGRVGLS